MPEVIRRFRSFEISKLVREDGPTPDAPKRNVIRMVASTSDPVNWGDWSEVLEHDAANVDSSAARALLLNHRSGMLVGPIRSISFDGKQSDIEAEILPDARMESGILVSDAVESGALRGVSIGYDYHRDDTEWDEDARCLTVRSWKMREASLTPIPADAGASVRELPAGVISKQRNTMPDLPKNDDAAKAEAAIKEREVAAASARSAIDKAIVAKAESHGLRAVDFIGQFDSEVAGDSAILAAITKRDAEKMKDPLGVSGPASVGVEHADKLREAVADAMVAKVFGTQPANGNPVASRSFRDIAKKYAMAMGVRGADQWEKEDCAYFYLGHPEHIRSMGSRDAANITTGNFAAFTQLNALTKIVGKGFEMRPENLAYPKISEANLVPDFKTFYIGALGTGNMAQVAEDLPMPELIKAEGVYNDIAKMWGGTLSLTIQALVSDDTGQFERSLRNAGAILQKVIDKRVLQKLLMGTSSSSGTSTWTNNTTSGGSLVYTTADSLSAARGRLGKVRAALLNKVGLDSNPLGTLPRFIVVGPTNGQNIYGLLNSGPGATVGNSPSLQGLEVIETPWLEASALTGNSTTSYYIGADPMLTTGLVVSRVAGFESPTVMEYDAGATTSRKWKIFMPFEASLVNITNPAGTKIVPGWQQGTT